MSRPVPPPQHPEFFELGDSLTRLFLESLSFECDWIRPRQPWPAHGTHGWRTLPSLLVLVAIKGRYECALENGVRFTSGPGEAVVLAAGVPHRVQFPVEGTLVAAHLSYRVLGGIDVMCFFDIPPHLPRQVGTRVGTLLDRIARNRQTKSFGIASGVREKALAFELLSLLLQQGSPRSIDVARLANLQRLSRVLEFIHEHVDEPLSIRELCRQAQLSRQRFHTVFKEASGFSPKEYVSRAKIQKAKQMLISKDLSVANISDRLGFCNPFHFSRQFKLFAAVSPSAYRRRIFEYELLDKKSEN